MFVGILLKLRCVFNTFLFWMNVLKNGWIWECIWNSCLALRIQSLRCLCGVPQGSILGPLQLCLHAATRSQYTHTAQSFLCRSHFFPESINITWLFLRSCVNCRMSLKIFQGNVDSVRNLNSAVTQSFYKILIFNHHYTNTQEPLCICHTMYWLL